MFKTYEKDLLAVEKSFSLSNEIFFRIDYFFTAIMLCCHDNSNVGLLCVHSFMITHTQCFMLVRNDVSMYQVVSLSNILLQSYRPKTYITSLVA